MSRGLSRAGDPKCIVCGSPIAKAWLYHNVRTPEQAERGIGGSDWVTAELRGEDDIRRITNAPHIRIAHMDDGRVSAFQTWDGEGYRDRFFCKQACAVRQGYASARHGERFTWGPAQ